LYILDLKLYLYILDIVELDYINYYI